MDWLLLIGLVLLLVVGGVASFYLYMLIARTKNEFRTAQPDLRIANLSAMNSGDILTLYPELENVGRGVAYDCVMHLGGWEGNFAVKKVYPRGPRYEKHVVAIVLGPEAPIRVNPISHGYLRLRYQDRWEQKYERWYSVTQVSSDAMPPYNPQIDLEHPELTEPCPSVWEMRKLLRSTSFYD
jgi:hypothetical protein